MKYLEYLSPRLKLKNTIEPHSLVIFSPRIPEKFHSQLLDVLVRRQNRKTRTLDSVNNTFDTKQFAFLFHEKSVIGVMYSIVSVRTVVYKDWRTSLSQVWDGQQRGAHGLLDWKEGTDSQIMGVPDMASDDGACGATRGVARAELFMLALLAPRRLSLGRT